MTSEQAPPLIGTAAQIRQGAIRLAQQMLARRSPGALSGSKLRVLGHLRRRGAATAGELAAAQNQQPQSLTRVLTELELDGLVSRVRDERDRRQSVIAITAEGGRALASSMAECDRWLADAIAGLTETERQVLLLAGRLMDQIADTTLTARGHSPDAGDAGDRATLDAGW